MAEQQVCNINFYLYLSFIFGFYHDFGFSRRARWMATLYCLFVYVIIIFCMYVYCIMVSFDGIVLSLLLTAEYLSYVLISMVKKHEYLLKYYKKMILIDDISNARVHKKLRVCLMAFMVFNLLFIIIMYLVFSHVYWNKYQLNLYSMLFETIILTIMICGRISVVFVFSLMYCRVRLMRTTLERNDFNCNSLGNHHPRRYIQMYETIMDSFEETDNPVKLKLCIFNLLSILYFIFIFSSLLQMAKNNELDMGFALWTLLELISAYMPMVVCAILSDLTYEEVQEMLAITVERRIKSRNERDYAEIQKLFEFMKRRPYNYTIWRVIPLNVRTLFTVTSFCITTIIAILQIKSSNLMLDP